VSFLRGLVVGLAIAALQIGVTHVSFDYQKLSVQGNAVIAAAIPVFLLPLAIAWGWTWVSDRWAGRSGPRLLLYTFGLVLGAASAMPADYALLNTGQVQTWKVIDLSLVGLIFVMPVVAMASILYWVFASGKVSASLGTLGIAYLGGLFLALVMPSLAMGTVAGTAAGHSWQKPGARGAITFLVVLLMLVGVFELPMAAAASSFTFAP
jgi:hypothetical protein